VPKAQTPALTVAAATPVVAQAVIDALADKILRLYRTTTLDFSIAVGKMVVDDLYEGDIQRWRDHGATDGSFRRVAEKLKKQGRALSATALQQAVGVFDLELRVGVTARPQLTATHIRAVVGLPAVQQEALLGTSEARDWTSDKLEKEATKARAKLATRPGRKPLHPVVRTTNQWKRDLDDADNFGDLDKLAELHPDEKARMAKTLAALRDRCDALLAKLKG
jgi:hypothetical protein